MGKGCDGGGCTHVIFLSQLLRKKDNARGFEVEVNIGSGWIRFDVLRVFAG